MFFVFIEGTLCALSFFIVYHLSCKRGEEDIVIKT
jgi:hypothetical protein